MDELPADFGVVVDEEHAAAALRRRLRRSEARRPGADHEHVAARIEVRIVGRRAVVRVDPAEAGHGADRRLEGFPARPKKRLVVEAGRHEGARICRSARRGPRPPSARR